RRVSVPHTARGPARATAAIGPPIGKEGGRRTARGRGRRIAAIGHPTARALIDRPIETEENVLRTAAGTAHPTAPTGLLTRVIALRLAMRTARPASLHLSTTMMTHPGHGAPMRRRPSEPARINRKTSCFGTAQ